jgi:hypothetical protein
MSGALSNIERIAWVAQALFITCTNDYVATKACIPGLQRTIGR